MPWKDYLKEITSAELAAHSRRFSFLYSIYKYLSGDRKLWDNLVFGGTDFMTAHLKSNFLVEGNAGSTVRPLFTCSELGGENLRSVRGLRRGVRYVLEIYLNQSDPGHDLGATVTLDILQEMLIARYHNARIPYYEFKEKYEAGLRDEAYDFTILYQSHRRSAESVDRETNKLNINFYTEV